ncbi:hypothetical protein MBH78_03545 [Oceanimonas sp. NS1]|nr:hypothetical protein [Oceanimonas sp. NS1]
MDVEREEGKVLACCCMPESDLVIEADIDADPDFAGYPVQDYNGTVTEILPLSPTIRGLRIRLDRNMEFQAGQYINLHVPGVAGSRASPGQPALFFAGNRTARTQGRRRQGHDLAA